MQVFVQKIFQKKNYQKGFLTPCSFLLHPVLLLQLGSLS